jgi:hypothetical protein
MVVRVSEYGSSAAMPFSFHPLVLTSPYGVDQRKNRYAFTQTTPDLTRATGPDRL